MKIKTDPKTLTRVSKLIASTFFNIEHRGFVKRPCANIALAPIKKQSVFQQVHRFIKSVAIGASYTAAKMQGVLCTWGAQHTLHFR